MKIKKHNAVVHTLWIAPPLTSLELLTINSFVKNGHTICLWTYGEIDLPPSKYLLIKDANEFIPSDKVFQYKNKNQFGHGKGSFAGFSDIFRYKLLYEHGGWWADMDVTCLKALDFEAPYVFRTHHDLAVVGNIMKCPPKSELMKRCYEKAASTVDAENKDWNKPIRILEETIYELGLQKYIINISNRDSWNDIRLLVFKEKNIPENWYVIHWVNEEWRRNKINKEYVGHNSLLAKLYRKYDVETKSLLLYSRLKNRFRLSFSFAVFWYLWGFVDYYLKKYFKRNQ